MAVAILKLANLTELEFSWITSLYFYIQSIVEFVSSFGARFDFIWFWNSYDLD